VEGFYSSPILYRFRVGNAKAWSNEISFKTDCPTVTKHTFAVMGDMGTVIPAGYLVAKQIEEDHQVTPFSAVVHVGDISYAGTGSTDEIAVSLERWRMTTTNLSLVILGNLGHMGSTGRADLIHSTLYDKCGQSRVLLQLYSLS
jgi:hypothetical protein